VANQILIPPDGAIVLSVATSANLFRQPNLKS
jgi:hypothetical protein